MTATSVAPSPRWLGVLGWTVMVLLSLAIGVYGLLYLFGAQAPPVVEDNGMGMTMLAAHASAAGIALLIGPLQFIETIRRRAPRVHRWIGRTYIVACLFAGIVGALLAPFTAAGPIAASGFFALAVTWLWVNALGWRAAALQRDYAAHKRWMVRSFALTFAAVTLRLYLVPVEVGGLDFVTYYQWIAWLCWIPNLLIAEFWLAARRPARIPAPKGSAA
jgi:hypothetical protein